MIWGINYVCSTNDEGCVIDTNQSSVLSARGLFWIHNPKYMSNSSSVIAIARTTNNMAAPLLQWKVY